MTVNELRGLIFENYYKRIEFVKEKIHHSMKHLKKKRFFVACNQLIEQIAHPVNAKE